MSTTSQPKLTISKPSDREVRMSRVVDAPRTVVFEAWTSPEHLPHWMLGPPGWTMPVCEIDLRPGGTSRMVWAKGDGAEMEIRGTYREVERPSRIVQTESWGPEWPEMVNTIDFMEVDGKTTVTITILFVSREARDAATKTGMSDGMSMGFDRLDEYLSRR